MNLPAPLLHVAAKAHNVRSHSYREVLQDALVSVDSSASGHLCRQLCDLLHAPAHGEYKGIKHCVLMAHLLDRNTLRWHT